MSLTDRTEHLGRFVAVLSLVIWRFSYFAEEKEFPNCIVRFEGNNFIHPACLTFADFILCGII